MARHPSQLYEAFLEGPVTFVILLLVFRQRFYRGAVLWCFIGLYGLFRFLVEFFREPDAQIGFIAGNLSMGQLLSMPMAIFGFTMFVIWARKQEKAP